MTTPATQLTITIPEGAPPGSLLQIPIKGGQEKVKARVPEGLGAGSTLVLTKLEGSDEWVEEVGDVRPLPAGSMRHSAMASVEERAPAPPLPQISPEAPPVNGPVAYTVRLDTTVGVIDIIVRPDWAPHGARRFLDLAAIGDLDDLAFYRSVKGCLAQFGLPARRPWPPLLDDPPTGVPFLLGAVCFAAVGQNSRKSTLFICIGDMSHCFGQQSWETPIGAVAESSLDVLDRIETIYGDIAECNGSGPDTGRINVEGNNYLRDQFPLLTYIRSAWPLDWQPPIQEVEQVSQASRAAQAAQAAHVVETAAAAGHAAQAAQAAAAVQAAQAAQAHQAREHDATVRQAWNEAQHARDTDATMRPAWNEAAQLDTTEMLRKLEVQEKAHQATMKEMEKKIAEAAKAAHLVQAAAEAAGNANAMRHSASSSTTPATGAMARAAAGAATNGHAQQQDFSQPARAAPDGIHSRTAIDGTPNRTPGVGVPVETVGTPSPRGSPVVDVPVEIMPASSRQPFRGREVPVEVNNLRIASGAAQRVPAVGSGASPTIVSRASPMPPANQSPMRQRPSSVEIAQAGPTPVSHSVVYDNSAMFASPEFSRHVRGPTPQPFPPQHHPYGAPPPHAGPPPGSHPLGSQLVPPGIAPPGYGDPNNMYGQPRGPPPPMQAPPVGPPNPYSFQGPPPSMMPPLGAPPSGFQPPVQNPNFPAAGMDLADVAAVGAAALAPGNFSQGGPPPQPWAQNFPPPGGHMTPQPPGPHPLASRGFGAPPAPGWPMY